MLPEDEIRLQTEKAHELMACVMDHYVKHHKVVLKKLGHAHSATLKSIEEIDDICVRYSIRPDSAEFQEVRRYDKMWEEIIALFRQKGASEEDLLKIDEILTGIPQAIKHYYDLLVAQDRALKKLIAQLDFDRYREACTAIAQIQGGPNIMSGLLPQQYGEENLSASIFHPRSLKSSHSSDTA